jgi:tetratricopeptide (TPR) repeat protein
MELTLDDALQQAVEAHKGGQVKEAERLYTAILNAQPKHANANYNMGVLAVGAGRTPESLPFFKTALETNPSIVQYWLSYTDALIQLDQIVDAQTVLDQAKGKGASGQAFERLEQRLNELTETQVEADLYIDGQNQVRPNVLDSLKLDQAIRLARKKAKEGSPEDSNRIYNDILTKFPQNKRALDGIKSLSGRFIGKASKVQDPSQDQIQPLINLYQQGQFQQALDSTKQLLKQFPNSLTLYNIQGAADAGLGQFDAAIDSYIRALKIKPDNADAYNNMGTALNDKGDPEAAIDSFKQALKIEPDFAEAYSNMGKALKVKGKLDASIDSYQNAIRIKPDYANAYNNMGIALNDKGDLEAAIDSYQKAISIEPGYAEAFNNMGAAQKDKGDLEAAIESFKHALIINPDYAEAYNNMGIALKNKGDLEAAIDSYKQALKIKPDSAETYSNIGIALKEKGYLEAAIDSYQQALKINPDLARVWNNLIFPLQAIKLQVPSVEKLLSKINPKTGSQYAQIAKSILSFSLHQGGNNAERALNEVYRLLSKADDRITRNPEVTNKESPPQIIGPDNTVALVHFGRSGTGLLHSLIDYHPEVSTMPSIYFSEFFNHSTWEKIVSEGWSKMVDHFIANYEVLFDASTRSPIQTKSKHHINYLGQKDGMANVGDQRDEVLRVDKALFRLELRRLMDLNDHLDAYVFFKLVHMAYDKALKDHNLKNLIFYHIHNPDNYAKLNFAHAAPNASWVMMVREPIQACESWVNSDFHKNEYTDILTKIITMLFEIDNILYHKQRSVGVRLEDLKEFPRKTIPALCDWMGIEETESLYEMTAQGKKWWGDPISPDYAKDGMEPFGTTSIRRKVGIVFTENDQFILRTLFHPFSVRFGYVEENLEQFKADLKAIRPMLDKMFGFEKTLVERTQADAGQFVKSGSYLYLRSGLIERWNVLAKCHTYPNMIKPLKIKFKQN